MIKRELLSEVKQKALEEANVQGCASSWRRAYLALADAAVNLEMRITLFEITKIEATKKK